MERKCRIMIWVTSLLLANSLAAFAGPADVYYPYDTYDQYYKEHSVNPPPTAAKPLPPDNPVPKPLPQAEPPVKVTEPPLFLFPPELGFGVAVAVPFDMFYLSKGYYTVKSGNWYHAPTYRGPWSVMGLSRVPPELRKPSLTKIHKLRNVEFEKYWKNKAHYEGKAFRPTDEIPAPLKTEKAK